MQEVVIFWFRRDLRLEDNNGLWHALSSGYPVLPLFIYDENILSRLEPDDRRMSFLRDILQGLHSSLKSYGSSLFTVYSSPARAFRDLSERFNIKGIYFNRDYEPYALSRDSEIISFFRSKGTPVHSFKDQVIFEMSEVMKNDGNPYTVYTPYSVKWLSQFSSEKLTAFNSRDILSGFIKSGVQEFFTPEKAGFICPPYKMRSPDISGEHLSEYHKTRDIPSANGTSFLGPYLRFGTISIREVLRRTSGLNMVFVRELIWREFFMQILYHFPHLTEKSYRPEYDKIEWLNNEEHFERWREGKTGYPLVDAGMRELKETGFMHNRVRMLAASFLTKHLLIDWRWGEAWFASQLFDFELSSNNGNWQWAAGCGCDAAPYFRVFNPDIQLQKFDPELKYVSKWIPELATSGYPAPVVDHKSARDRAIKHYRSGFTR